MLLWRLTILKFSTQAIRLETQGKTNAVVQVERASAGTIFSYLRIQFFFLFKISTDWMRPASIMEDNLLYSTFNNLNLSFKPPLNSHRNI
jgi:hypothetical protein